VEKRRLGFLEDAIDEVSVSKEVNRYVVSLVPYEKTTTFKKGTENAPRAIVDVSPQMELLDEVLHVNASSHGVLTLSPRISDLRSITAHAASVAREHPDALLAFLGGEHSITPAILEGLARKEMGIVWIDAHPDLRKEYRGSPDNHACAGFQSAVYGPIVQIGVRSLSEEQVEFLGRSDRVKCFRWWGEAVKNAVRALPKNVYLSIDMDGFSPTLVRAVGTPEPGGLEWEEAMEILDFVFKEKDVFAYDVVELCPQADDVVSSFTAARLVYKAMSYHTYHKLTTHVRPRS
jgi:agmatinase